MCSAHGATIHNRTHLCKGTMGKGYRKNKQQQYSKYLHELILAQKYSLSVLVLVTMFMIILDKPSGG